MATPKRWTLICPICRNKIPVMVEPLPDWAICPHCNTKLKVVKELLVMAQPINSALPRKEVFTYNLIPIKE